jgi:hypothetical protein
MGFLSSRMYFCGIACHDDHDASVGRSSGIRTRPIVLPLIVLLFLYSRKSCIHFVLAWDLSFYVLWVASTIHFLRYDANGAPSTPYIFRFVPTISFKFGGSLAFILFECFRVLVPCHCPYNVLWNLSSLTFCVSICCPVGILHYFLLHYIWTVFYLY